LENFILLVWRGKECLVNATKVGFEWVDDGPEKKNTFARRGPNRGNPLGEALKKGVKLDKPRK